MQHRKYILPDARFPFQGVLNAITLAGVTLPMRYLVIVIALIVLPACSRRPAPEDAVQSPQSGSISLDYRRAADSLRRTDPIAAAETAVARGDIRFLGVQGYAVVVPGLGAESHRKFYEDSVAVRIIPGTSDSWVDDDAKRFNIAPRTLQRGTIRPSFE